MTNIEPMVCRSRAELVRALAHVRESRGLSQLELDDLAGFPSGYTAKLERPAALGQPDQRKAGRNAIPLTFDYWLQAVGVALYVVPEHRGVPVKFSDVQKKAKTPKHRLPKITAKVRDRIKAHMDAELRNIAKHYQIGVKDARAILAGKG